MSNRTPITAKGLIDLGFEIEKHHEDNEVYYNFKISKFDCVTELSPFHRMEIVDKFGEFSDKLILDIDNYSFSTYSASDDYHKEVGFIYFYVEDFESPYFKFMYIEQIISMYNLLTGEDIV